MSAHSHSAAVDDPQGPPHVHHMDSTTAYHAAKFGMWLFLATEILLFAVMFCCLAIYKYDYLREFHDASHHLSVKLGTINTLVLLFSSFCAARAVDAAQHGKNKGLTGVVGWISMTLVCGLIFLCIKFVEYQEKYHHGIFPGLSTWADQSQSYKMYFGLYFTMTGLHALHVIIGMGLLAIWPLRKALQNRFSDRYYTPVEVGALYWHLVDLVWIYLFPLLYLIG
jgi:cytochrome c oxidase subunit III